MILYLASGSPRRRELLDQLGIPFTVVKSTYEEHNEQYESPYELVEQQALGKALAAVLPTEAKGNAHTVLGADTIVVHKGHKLGKPHDVEGAKAMLGELAGDYHEVVTGVALCHYDSNGDLLGQSVFHVCTKVYFFDLTEADIEAYVATGEPMDKAGAYGIQGKGAYLVKGIEGSYTNVVGLPIEVVARKLKDGSC